MGSCHTNKHLLQRWDRLCMVEAGLDPKDYAGHSSRIRAATTAAAHRFSGELCDKDTGLVAKLCLFALCSNTTGTFDWVIKVGSRSQLLVATILSLVIEIQSNRHSTGRKGKVLLWAIVGDWPCNFQYVPQAPREVDVLRNGETGGKKRTSAGEWDRIS